MNFFVAFANRPPNGDALRGILVGIPTDPVDPNNFNEFQ
jgi:hypothetical protein